MKGKHSKKKKSNQETHTHTTSHTHTNTHTQMDAYYSTAFRNKQHQKNNNLHIHLKWNSQINCWVYTQKILLILKNKQTVFIYTEDGS